jgi:hypothetical protein
MASEKFSNPARSGYNKGTIRSAIRYHVVSKDVRRHRLISINYIKTLCRHGRGREFESRRPRHSFKHLEEIGKNCHGPLWSKSKKTHPKSGWLFRLFCPIVVQDLRNCRLLVRHHPHNLALRQSFFWHPPCAYKSSVMRLFGAPFTFPARELGRGSQDIGPNIIN